MKSILSLLGLLASSSFALDASLGADISGILTMPSNSPSGIEGKVGFGMRATPAIGLALNDYLAVRGSMGYELTTWGTKSSGSVLGVSYSSDSSIVTQFITFGIAGEVYLVPKVMFVSLGTSVDMPIKSSYTYKRTLAGASVTTDGEITGDQNSVFLDLGAGVQLLPSLGVVAGYRLPVVPYYDRNDETNKLRQVSLGIRITIL